MMSTSRKLLVMGSVVVGFLFLATIVTFLSGGTKDGDQKTCDKFISYVMKQDFRNSYSMLSSTAASSDTPSAWQAKVLSLTNAYKQAKVTFVSKVPQYDSAKSGKNASIPTRQALNYTIVNPIAKSQVVCYVTKVSDKNVIDGFTSRIE